MKVFITKLTTGLAVAALVALPASAAAQTPPSQPPAAPPATTESQPPAAAQKTPDQTSTTSIEAAREHLAKAKAALADVNPASLSARAKSLVADVNRRINALERSIAASETASATGTASRDTSATSGSRGSTDWGTEVGAIDKTLTALLGPESATGAATPAPTGTSGSAAANPATLDETTRTKLMEVRTHLTAFATAMAGGAPKAPSPSTDPTTDPNAALQPTGTSGMTQAQTPPPTGTQAAQPGMQTGQPDEQAARRHLTEARNTLSAIAQLPAAAQLSGETRGQVSQLISNFNELITSQSDWRSAYAKVSANLNALIGADPATVDPSVSGTSGTVGTSGTAASLDPEIRSRLIELRRQLNEFEKASGGGTAASAGAAVNPATPDPNAPATTPPTTTPPSSTPPATAPPSATSPTPGMQAGAGTPAAGNAEVMRHIAAIEALLKSEDDSGGVTLTKAQLEQLRTHLASLRQAVAR